MGKIKDANGDSFVSLLYPFKACFSFFRNGSEWWRLRSTFQKNFTAPQSVKEHVTDTDAVVQDLVRYVKDFNISSKDDFLESLNRLNLESM